MGRTIPSFRIALEDEIASWKSYGRSLSYSSKQRLSALFDAARNYLLCFLERRQANSVSGHVHGARAAVISIRANNRSHSVLSQIVKAANGGSVISRDHAVGILTKLAKMKEVATSCLPLLLEQLKKCPNSQFPLYSEMSLPVINETNRKAFVKLFMNRLGGLERK
ncbi:MAG: hypothetical protein HYZ12_03740 [Thaumarchaeota archaeon]|nr:hypothetical protein [Nitrososphaerota archaeon]